LVAARRRMTDHSQIALDFDLTTEERAVLRHLRRGRKNAISMPELAAAVGVSTRALQDIISHIIQDHKTLICSACGKNHGYYLPVDESEYRAGVNQLKHRIISLAKRMRAMDKEAYTEIFGGRELI
jgi:hypothetical protein